MKPIELESYPQPDSWNYMYFARNLQLNRMMSITRIHSYGSYCAKPTEVRHTEVVSSAESLSSNDQIARNLHINCTKPINTPKRLHETSNELRQTYRTPDSYCSKPLIKNCTVGVHKEITWLGNLRVARNLYMFYTKPSVN